MHISNQAGMLPFCIESVLASNPHRNDCSEDFMAWHFGNILLARIDCFASQLAVLSAPILFAPVAQLDRASDFGSEGWGFDSLRA